MRNKIAGVAANTMVKCIDSFVLNVDDDSNIISTRNSYTASVQGGGNLGMHTKYNRVEETSCSSKTRK